MRIVRWWFSPVPLARVAVFRALVYLFIIWSVFNLTNDVVGHGYAPELYRPTLLGRALPFPEPSVPLAYGLLAVIVVGGLVAASGRLPRLAGWTVAAAYLAWMVNTQGFAYVSHDHMALVAAALLLPTVGAAHFTDNRTSESAGWVLRCVQVLTVATYAGSALAKVIYNSSLTAWANSSIFTWAIMRRGSALVEWTLEVPVVLRLSQWGVFLLEVLTPVVFWLRGRWQYAMICVFFAFHLMTYLALGIHFLPTIVCWFAFFPLERVVPHVQRAWLRTVGVVASWRPALQQS